MKFVPKYLWKRNDVHLQDQGDVCVGHGIMESWWDEELNPSLADRIYSCEVRVWCQCADSMQELKRVVEVLTVLLFYLATSSDSPVILFGHKW